MVALAEWIESEKPLPEPKTRVWDFFGDAPDRVGKLAPQVPDGVWVIELRIYDSRRSPSLDRSSDAANASMTAPLGYAAAAELGRQSIMQTTSSVIAEGGAASLGVAATAVTTEVTVGLSLTYTLLATVNSWYTGYENGVTALPGPAILVGPAKSPIEQLGPMPMGTGLQILESKAHGKGERNRTRNASGTGNEYKHMRPHPTDKNKVIVKDQYGRNIIKPKPEGFDG